MKRFLETVNEIMEFKEEFVDGLNVYFGQWALFVYDHPWRVITGALILAGLPIIGFVPPIATWTEGADKLYALPVSEARNQGILHDSIFAGGISRAEFLIVTSDPPGDNLLDWDILETVREIDQMVRGQRVDDETNRLIAIPAIPEFYPEWYEDRNATGSSGAQEEPVKKYLTYEDICAKDPVMGCKVQSIFEMGVDDMKMMLPPNSPPELWLFDGLVFNSKKKGFSPDFVLGGLKGEACVRSLPTALISMLYTPDRYTLDASTPGYSIVSDMKCISEVKAFNFVYELADSPRLLPRELAWEAVYYDLLKNNKHFGPGSPSLSAKGTNGANAAGIELEATDNSASGTGVGASGTGVKLLLGANAFRSRDDELSKSTAESSDIIFVLYTFILLITYTTLVNFNFDQYRNKATCSLAGSISCLLGLVFGLGIPPLFGVAFVPTALVTPFLVMGVGADDIFVLISSYVLTYGEDSPRQRCAACLRGCGVSVVMTTITNIIAFAIGIQSPYLSIKNFCIFTLFGLFGSLIFELTLFFAFLCIEARKEDRQRACICHNLNVDEEKTAFDIHHVVSTYQLVSVLVQEAVQDLPSYAPIPHPHPHPHPGSATHPVAHPVSSRDGVEHPVSSPPPRSKFDGEKEEAAGRKGVSRLLKSPFVHSWHFIRTQGSLAYAPNEALYPSKTEPETRPGSEIDSPASGEGADDGDETMRMLQRPPPVTTLASRGGTSPLPPSARGEGGRKKELWEEYLAPAAVPVNRFDLNHKLRAAVYRSEPKGNVGRRWRQGFARIYCRWLLNPYVKAGVLVVFSINIAIFCYGFSKMQQGLEMKDLSPDNSYLRTYDELQSKFLNKVDLPVEVFYPDEVPWHDVRAQNTLRLFLERVQSREENYLINDPLTRMLADPGLTGGLTSGNATVFSSTLKAALANPNSAYKQFEFDFAWSGEKLLSFRQQLLPKGTTKSQERAHWMMLLRGDCEWVSQLKEDDEVLPFRVMFYNYMLVFYESDIQITASVISSLSTASMAMLVVALLLIPDIFSGLIVMFIMFLIDMTIIGYMSFWQVPLNMISMVILVISIGFAVDYSAHVTYAFVSGIGPTRDLRATESIVIVGTPLFHGAMANFLGIMLLGFSTSYILRIFFKMMTLVVVLGIAHGMILLPVILSLIGNMAASLPVYDAKHKVIQDCPATHAKLKKPTPQTSSEGGASKLLLRGDSRESVNPFKKWLPWKRMASKSSLYSASSFAPGRELTIFRNDSNAHTHTHLEARSFTINPMTIDPATVDVNSGGNGKLRASPEALWFENGKMVQENKAREDGTERVGTESTITGEGVEGEGGKKKKAVNFQLPIPKSPNVLHLNQPTQNPHNNQPDNTHTHTHTHQSQIVGDENEPLTDFNQTPVPRKRK